MPRNQTISYFQIRSKIQAVIENNALLTIDNVSAVRRSIKVADTHDSGRVEMSVGIRELAHDRLPTSSETTSMLSKS